MQKTASVISEPQKKFFAELIGTFVVVVCATGSVVINAQSGGSIGLWFEAFAPFAAVSAMVFLFGKISMAHFNPAVTVAFLITRHLPPKLLPVYLGAEFAGAFLASLFVKFMIGTQANLGANHPNYEYTIPQIFGVEVLATSILISMILIVVYTKGLKGFGSVAIGSMIFFDIFFLSSISGASMNPIRSLAPAALSGAVGDLWLYWSAPFAGAAIIGTAFKNKFKA
ncbi:MAG: aquaporin [Candidatus Nitrosotenuis sp.]